MALYQVHFTIHDFKGTSLLSKFDHLSYIYKTSCFSVTTFLGHQKSHFHDILALGLIWANLDHYEARFSTF